MPRLSFRECLLELSSSECVDFPLTGFCVDTRLLRPGYLFFALPGAQVDGHCFLEQAAALGACAAVVKSDYQGSDFGLFFIRVPDVLAALQNLASVAIKKSRSKVVAVTGSVGKTTTKEFISMLLKQKYRVAQTPGNNNSQIGLPLAILNHTTGDEDFIVLEMGLSVKGQIARLVQIAPPDIALITTTALVHAENFESLEAIGRAKAEIFSHPHTRLGILHRDIENFDELCEKNICLKISFSTTNPEADYYLQETQEGAVVSRRGLASALLKPLNKLVKHNRHNFLAAAVVCFHCGVTWKEIDAAVNLLSLPSMRLETVEKNGILFLNDSYNASEISVKAALETLPAPKKDGKKIAVLGEMLELGKFSEACHKAIGEYALDFVDEIICFGDDCKPIQEVWMTAGKPVFFTSDRNALVKQVKNVVKSGDVVLLKGSRSKGMWKILDEF